MGAPERPTAPSADPRWAIRLTDDGSPTLVETAGGWAMHSGCGARSETRHVYVEGSGVGQRLRAGLATTVLEVGLGSGMAWLMTAQEARRGTATLRYLALEISPPPARVVRQLALQHHAASADLVEAYCRWLQADPCRSGNAVACDETGQPALGPRFRYDASSLELLLGDAADWCRCLCSDDRDAPRPPPCDAVYFDPYAPQVSPRLWQSDVFAGLRTLLSPQGRLVTYCVSRAVRDAITAAGFRAQKVRGPPGGKREVLVAAPIAFPKPTRES